MRWGIIALVGRAIWNGPFHIGKLTQPVSVGDVLLKTLETIWRCFIVLIALAIVAAVGIGLALLAQNGFFPPLTQQISAWAVYDDGSAPLITPPVVGGTPQKPFRCTKDYPVKVHFNNNSNKTVGSVHFMISAKYPGRSTDIASGAGYYTDDTILLPKYWTERCWPIATEYQADPSKLDYSVKIWSAEAQQ